MKKTVWFKADFFKFFLIAMLAFTPVLLVAVFLIWWLLGHAVLDPVVVGWKLRSLARDPSRWQRQELNTLGVSVAYPAELRFSESQDNSSWDLGTEYYFELPATQLRHEISFSVSRNFKRETGGWIGPCYEKLDAIGETTTANIYWVDCGEYTGTFFIHTPEQELRMGFGTLYNHPDHPAATKNEIKNFAEKMLGTIELSN